MALLPGVGQAQTVEWARSAGGLAIDKGIRIAVDTAGNSYVTGHFADTATFGPFTLTSSGHFDVFVVKYDASGNILWVRSEGGTSEDRGTGVAIDGAGNIYVTGEFSGTATFGSFTLTGAGDSDIFVAKYDGSGNILWARSAGGTLSDTGWRLAVDGAGNTYVTGEFSGTATFGSLTLTSMGDFDMFVAKYDTNGNVLWARSGGGKGNDVAFTIAVDAGGHSYVTGVFSDTAIFGPFTLTSTGGFHVFLAKYDCSGNLFWIQSVEGRRVRARGLGLDSEGNVYVTGSFGNTVTFGPFTLTNTFNLGLDIFVAKYDSDGNVLWARSDGFLGSEEGNDIAVDTAGNSYVTGHFAHTANFGPFTLSSRGGFDIFVAKYDASGNVLWARSAGGIYSHRGEGIAIDGAGNTYVTGNFSDTATFGSFSLTGAGNGDIFVAKFAGTCGNGSSDPGEECDGGLGCTGCLCDADFEPTDPSSFDCQPICGNGIVDPDEECDDGRESATCDADCTLTQCGDGTINVTAGEECDDGNTQPGDGCDENCRFDPGACCVSTACSITTESNCSGSGGSFLGLNSTCDIPDADGDGLRDECDECPNDSDKIEPGVCGCNVDDDADGDGDGIPDCVDLCPGVDDAVFAPGCKNAIPTVSAWGLIVMALLLLAGAKVYFNRRSPAE